MPFDYEDPVFLYQGKRFDVISFKAPHPKNLNARKEAVNHLGAVVILPFLDSETIILIENVRPVVQEALWELPAGTLEKGEDPKQCAYREILEETGYRCKDLEFLFQCYSTPGFCNEILYFYVAKKLTLSKQNLDDSEQITVHKVNFQTALQWIGEGKIKDAKTICALFFANQFKKID